MIDLYPAIDLLAGKVVRLRQGDYADQTTYGDDPVAVAQSFAAAGARWIHVVDLDAARTGSPLNRPVVAAIASAVAGQAQVQTGGGVRTIGDAMSLADAGVARVVMGSAAVAEPRLVAEASTVVSVAVGLDHRNGEVAVHGWTEGSGVQLVDALGWFPTATVFVITDIARDGMLAGPDLAGLAAAAQATATPLIASGGVAPLANGRVVKGVNFVGLRDAGDPVELAAKYDLDGADELVFLDITASSDGRDTMVDVVYRTAEQVFIPFTVGGGIRTVDDARTMLRAGKVSVNTAAVHRPALISDIAAEFGAQCCVCAIDAKRMADGSGYEVYLHGGRTPTGIDALRWAEQATALGAGEILLTSMDRDGTKEGFDLELTRLIADAVRVPVIASGGVEVRPA